MNIADLYSTRIQKTFDEDQAEIVSILKANINKKFKLINYYKGMPLSYPATLTSVERGVADFDVQAEQAFAIEQSRFAFIRSPLFKHDVFAEIQYVNVKKRAALFVKFFYVEILAERRNFIRLEPDPNVTTVIESPLGVIEGSLFDLSLSGLNISINQYHALATGSATSTRFKLRNIEQTLEINVALPANLIKIKDDASPYSYKFSICPDRQLENSLSKYIFQRQIEIIREIKDAVN
jgi:hypothetical protein